MDHTAAAGEAAQIRATQALRPVVLPRKICKQRERALAVGPSQRGLETMPGPSGRKTTLSTMIAGRPMSANRYHLKVTCHSANWHSKRPPPCVPWVMLVMRNPDKNGPTKVAIVMLVYNPNGLRYDRRPAPSSESTKGISASHEKA